MITIEDIVDLPYPFDVRLSPDGTHVAYVVRRGSRTAVWLDGAQLTRSDGSEDQPRWYADGRRVAFRSDRTGQHQVFVVSLDGREPTQLTDDPGGVLSYALCPRDDRLAFVTPRPATVEDPIDIGLDEQAPLALDEPDRILRTRSLDGGTTTVAGPPGFVGAFAWSPDGNDLAFVRRGWPSLEGGAMPTTIETIAGRVLAHLPGGPDELAWTTAGLFYQGTVRMAPRSAQCLTRLSDGRRLVAGDEDCLGGGTGNAATICGHGPDDLAVLVARGLSTTLVRVDPVSGGTSDLLAPADGDIQSASVVGSHWAAVLSFGDRPAEVFVDGRQVSTLAPSRKWPQQQPFLWKSGDGMDLDGVVLLPSGHRGGPLPTVVIVHGGPYGSRVTSGFQYPFGSWTNWGLALANAGFAVLLPNFRGGLGHGEAFAQAEGGLPAQWDDVQTMVDAAIERGIADPDRLGIGGWSYGGLMSAWAVSHTDRYGAAIVGGAPAAHDIQAMGADLIRYAKRYGSMPWDGPAPLPHHEFDTIAYVSRVNRPVLVIHGEADVRVPVIHAIGYHRGLRECGKTAELVIYRGAPHTLMKREHRIDCARRFVGWFERWLRPARAGIAP